MSEPALIEIKNVFRTYVDTFDNKVEALSNVSLSVRKGEFVSIIGSSGCGKTTLLRLLAGLDSPNDGTLTIDGHEIKNPDPERGYVFQQGSLFPWLTVEKNIAAGLKARGVYKELKGDVAQYIEQVLCT